MPRSTVASLGKLIYWLVDCWFGYLMTIRPALANSQLVIFDRYLPDMLVDPLRYRLPAPVGRSPGCSYSLASSGSLHSARRLRRSAVQQRKQEVSLAESDAATDRVSGYVLKLCPTRYWLMQPCLSMK